MIRIRMGLLLLLGTGLFVVSGVSAGPVNGPSAADRSVKSVSDHFLEDVYFRYNPGRATAAGFYKYDSQLEDRSAEGIAAYLGALHAARTQMDNQSTAGLSPDAATDLQLLKNLADKRIMAFEVLKWQKVHAEYYTEISARSLYSLATDSSVPEKDRLSAVVAREKQIPALLQAAQKNIDKMPDELGYVAEHELVDLVPMVEKSLPAMFAGVADSKLQQAFQQSTREAATALKKYQLFIAPLLPENDFTDNIDEAALIRIIELDGTSGVTYDSLRQAADAEIKRLSAQIRETAEKITPGRETMFVVEEAQIAFPKATLEAGYREMLPMLPSLQGASLKPAPVVPEWARNVLPTMLPLRFPTGFMNMKFSIPGESRVRQVAGSRATSEGWSDYVATLMIEAGLVPPSVANGPDSAKRSQYFRLAMMNQSLTRVGTMAATLAHYQNNVKARPRNPAVFLAGHVYIRPLPAEEEMRLIRTDPLYFSDALGNLEILKLRADYKRAKGSTYDEMEFNRRVLAEAGAPIDVMRKSVLGDSSGPPI